MNKGSDISPPDRRQCPEHGRMVKNGSYFRISDSKKIERWRCLVCGKTTSQATGTACFGQNKRRVNNLLFALLSSGVSQRRAARILGVDKNTVARKKIFLGIQSFHQRNLYLRGIPRGSIRYVQFDEMESFEHTKMKPLSIAVAVNPENRHILGVEVSEMPARGPLAEKSKKKYGPRSDHRKQAMQKLFLRIKDVLSDDAELTSDQKPSYPNWIREINPNWQHVRVKGRKPCHTGQGELKEGGYDPLFYLNHTCAMIRDSVKRLARRSWCTTKKSENLATHLLIYQNYHNQKLVS